MNDFEILSKTRLTQLRLARITASRPRTTGSGGTLEVTCTYGLGKGPTPSKLIAKLELGIKGIPKTEEDTAEPAFTLDVEARGIFTFSEPLEVKAFEGKQELTAAMCQPLYTFAVKKAESFLADLGMRDVRLDLDLKDAGEQPGLTETKAITDDKIAPRERKPAAKRKR